MSRHGQLNSTYISVAAIVLGALFVAIHYYNSLLFLYFPDFVLDMRWLLLSFYIAGVALIIVGSYSHSSRAGLNDLKPTHDYYLTAGLVLLTIGVFSHIIDATVGLLIDEYPYTVRSLLLLSIRRGVWWLFLAGWSLGLAGCLIVIARRRAWLGSYGSLKLARWSQCALAFGAVVVLPAMVSEGLGPLLSSDAGSLVYELLSQFLLYVYPLGVLGLTIGWAVTISMRLGKSVSLFLAFYAIFLIAMAGLFSIGI